MSFKTLAKTTKPHVVKTTLLCPARTRLSRQKQKTKAETKTNNIHKQTRGRQTSPVEYHIYVKNLNKFVKTAVSEACVKTACQSQHLKHVVINFVACSAWSTFWVKFLTGAMLAVLWSNWQAQHQKKHQTQFHSYFMSRGRWNRRLHLIKAFFFCLKGRTFKKLWKQRRWRWWLGWLGNHFCSRSGVGLGPRRFRVLGGLESIRLFTVSS